MTRTTCAQTVDVFSDQNGGLIVMEKATGERLHLSFDDLCDLVVEIFFESTAREARKQ